MDDNHQRSWLAQALSKQCGVKVAEPVERNKQRIDHLRDLAEEDKMMEVMKKGLNYNDVLPWGLGMALGWRMIRSTPDF